MDIQTAKRWLFFMMTITLCLYATAQDTSNTLGHVSIASPTAASLGKYGDIPVNYHTGLPQISIPVYTIKSGHLSLPISLSYHASGLKVQEQASWVGAGWSLNAGGVITRTVVGAPDDRGNAPINNVSNGHYTDYGFNNYLNNSSGVPDDIAFSRGYKDGEPDLYFFNFGGYTGKFYFNDDRTPMIVPEQDFKIVPDYTLGPGFTGFTITTPDGIRYFFGKTGNNGTVDPIEGTTTATVENGINNANAAASSWYLNKIVSADGMDSVNLSYQQEKYSYYTIAMTPVLSINYSPSNVKFCGYNLVKNFTTGVRLSQINFANGTVTFNKAAAPRKDLAAGDDVNSSMTDVTNTSAYALGSIQITDNNGFCKKDSLYYGYFYGGNTSNLSSSDYGTYNLHSDTTRLRLDSIQEMTCNSTSTKIPPYKFTYFPELVPRHLSFGIDHWGFYNGITNNSTLVPTYTITTGGTPTTYTGATRDAFFPAMRGGALQKITYPTGGTTSFDFENHDTYTTTSSYNNNVLQNMRINEPGASAITQTVTFNIVSTGGDCNFTMYNRSTNYQPTFYIKNSSGQTQGSGPWILNIAPSSTTPSIFKNVLSKINLIGNR